MAPEQYRSAVTDDLQMIARHLDAMKLIDRDCASPNIVSEPTPDGHVSSNSDVVPNHHNSSSNRSSLNGSLNGSHGGNGMFPNGNNHNHNNNNNNDNIGTKIFDHVQSFFKNPSLDVSSLINKEMLKYDIKERNAIYEEVHGVGNICPDESEPGMVETALHNLHCELENLPLKDKLAYEESLSIPHSYVHTTDFALRFLRAELFDAKRAAIRLTMFLDTSKELFGPYTLERPIRLSDFTKKELKVLNTGRIQLLPYRDRGGRRVVVGIPSHQHNRHDPKTRSKIHVYLWWVASESVETQRKGVVLVVIHSPKISDAQGTTTAGSSGHNNNNAVVSASESEYDNYSDDSDGQQQDGRNQIRDIGGLPSFQFAKTYITRRKSMAVRMVAFHICTPDSPYYTLVRSFNTAMVKDERSRVKMHVGEDIENRYKLSGYGIPLDQLPITESGKIKTMHFKKWLQLRRNIEDPRSKFQQHESIVECPGLHDVVFRPSQSTMCHPGNVMFRGLVESKHLEHSVAPSREAKIDVTRSVMTAVKNLGGRFLVWNNQTWWTELTDEKQIYSKIAVFFRNSKVSAKAKTNRQSTKSSTYIFADQTIVNDKRRRLDFFDGSSSSSNSSRNDEPCFGIL